MRIQQVGANCVVKEIVSEEIKYYLLEAFGLLATHALSNLIRIHRNCFIIFVVLI